ncbi:MAG: right-handed parallel beta-helix repeat-containing protein [Bacteroidia bacterium]|nr:right-handed parallel beta-helix repeat-containing protein [Bacteroidia bacterium]
MQFAFCLLPPFGIGGASFVQTPIPGGNVSGTWTLTGSPYLIQGAIMIPNGQTLTIEPVVTVNFQGTYKLYVQGRVIAIGTPADTITFTAADTTTGWRGIRFDNTPATNDSSKLIYCKIQYGKATGTGLDTNSGTLYFINFSKAVISNCRISNNTAYSSGGGIYCTSGSPIIINNTITNNSASYDGGGINSSGSLTITENIIFNNSASYFGGGIYCSNTSSPTITNNTISNNSASSYGGGINCLNSSPTITNNTISNNSAYSDGGGIYCWYNSSPTITNNTITNNSASYGGGISCSYSNPTIFNNTISNNSNSSNGGGIFCSYGNPTIFNNTISNNSTNNHGGGIYCFQNNSTIFNNTISNNSANSSGGGIYCSYSSSPTITNNTISNNSSDYRGGGIYCEYSSNPTITNNTISNNDANNGGALYCKNNSNPTLRNTILWGNTASASGTQVFLNTEDSDPNFYYCALQGGTAAFGLNNCFYTGTYENNIEADALFVASSAGSGTGYDGLTADWSLQTGSPCINAGTPDTTGLNLPATDIAGNPRIINGRIDIGAYEYFIVSISENLTGLTVYPNPANAQITVETLHATSLRDATVSICDM